jgi:aromatic ring-opening dioxygenase catalytic subunit (LigB family)
MPTFFIPHGAGPCFFMDWNPPDTWHKMAAFLTGLRATLPRQPKAILIASGHWVTPTFALGGNAHPELIYDYRGFPPHTYQLRYDAAGSPALAAESSALLAAAGVAAAVDPARGLDHGIFIPLKVAFPAADIPIVPISIRSDLDAAAHLQAGQALQKLRDEDVLIIGSGMSFHNMRGYGDPAFGPISDQFDAWLTDAARDGRLADWEQAPGARLCHPPGEEEHLLPLMIAAGAGHSGERIFSDLVLETQISAFRFQ